MKIVGPCKTWGGKQKLADWIVGTFPANYAKMTYVEPFGGGAAVLLRKRPSSTEVYADADPLLANLFSCLRDSPCLLAARLRAVTYDEPTFEAAAASLEAVDCLDRAVATIVRSRMSRGGLGKAFAWSERLRGGRPGDVNAWENFKKALPALTARLQSTIIHHQDFEAVIDKYDSKHTLFFMDPPYLHSTRATKSAYRHEMSAKDHERLAERLKTIEGTFRLSGYPSEQYDAWYGSWAKVTQKRLPNHASQSKTKSTKTEVIWQPLNKP